MGSLRLPVQPLGIRRSQAKSLPRLTLMGRIPIPLGRASLPTLQLTQACASFLAWLGNLWTALRCSACFNEKSAWLLYRPDDTISSSRAVCHQNWHCSILLMSAIDAAPHVIRHLRQDSIQDSRMYRLTESLLVAVCE